MRDSGTKQRPTVKEIGERASVSRATAYAVLNAVSGKPTNIRVGKETRDKVLAVAQEMGYIRNELARSLATGKSYTLGLHFENLNLEFYGNFFKKLEELCYKNDYSLFAASSEFDPERERRNLQSFLNKQFDGVFVTHIDASCYDLLDTMIAYGTKVVTIGEYDAKKYPAIAFDEALVGKLMVEYLVERRHRNIAYMYAGKMNSLMADVHRWRSEHFATAAKTVGGLGDVKFFNIDNEMEGPDAIAQEFFKMDAADRPTAIVCSRDILALNLVTALQARGLSVPDDISVIGCDDLQASRYSSVPLTTVRLPVEELAMNAWEAMSQLIDKGQNSTTFKKVLIKPELIERKSVVSLNN